MITQAQHTELQNDNIAERVILSGRLLRKETLDNKLGDHVVFSKSNCTLITLINPDNTQRSVDMADPMFGHVVRSWVNEWARHAKDCTETV